MNHANVPGDMWYKLWPDCINCITKMDWLTVIELDGIKKTRCEHYCGKLPKYAPYLRTWGEAGTVKIGKQGKVNDRGVTMMMIGYANCHEGNVYRMLNPFTGRVSETRDVIWLQ